MDKQLNDLINKYNDDFLEESLENSFKIYKNNNNNNIQPKNNINSQNNRIDKNLFTINKNKEVKLKNISFKDIVLPNKSIKNNEKNDKEQLEDKQEIDFRIRQLKFCTSNYKGDNKEARIKQLREWKLNNKNLNAVNFKNKTKKDSLLAEIAKLNTENKKLKSKEDINFELKIKNVKDKIFEINKKIEIESLKEVHLKNEIDKNHKILEREVGEFENLDFIVNNDKLLVKRKQECDFLKNKIKMINIKNNSSTINPGIFKKKSLISKDYDTDKINTEISNNIQEINKFKCKNKNIKDRIGVLEIELKSNNAEFFNFKNLSTEKIKNDEELIEFYKKRLIKIFEERKKIKNTKIEEITDIVYENKECLNHINYNKIKDENTYIQENNAKLEDKLNDLDNVLNNLINEEKKPIDKIYSIKKDIEIKNIILNEIKDIISKHDTINIKILSELGLKYRKNLNNLKSKYN